MIGKEREAAIAEAYKRFPDQVEPCEDHPIGKIVIDRGALRYAFIEGAAFGSANGIQEG